MNDDFSSFNSNNEKCRSIKSAVLKLNYIILKIEYLVTNRFDF